MSVAKQLYQLQELDLEIDSDELALKQKASQLGERQALIRARDKLTAEQQRLDALGHQQHSAEWEIDDLVSKIATVEGQLYSGRITNPKELANLQHEVNVLKANRDQLENKALEIMDQVELAVADVAATKNELERLEVEWQSQQQQLSTGIDRLESELSDLKQKRRLISDGADAQAIALYEKLRKQKGQAMAKVEQGICRGCRISLPYSDIQQARSGNPVQCSSCGRILFLP